MLDEKYRFTLFGMREMSHMYDICVYERTRKQFSLRRCYLQKILLASFLWMIW